MTFFIVTFGILFVLGMAVAIVTGIQEQKKSKELKEEFFKQFE